MFILKTLELENFKSFIGKHEFLLDREPGLYYISGKNKLNPELGANGVGKTTLTDAIFWVLFNTTGRDNRPGAAVVPWQLEKGSCSVRLIIKVGKKTYEIMRSRRPNKLTLNYIDAEPRVVEQAEVERLIGLSEDMFRRTIILAQFGTFFLDLRPEQQSQMFSEALALDVWLKASKTAGMLRKKLDDDLIALTSKAASQKGRLKELKVSLERETEVAATYDQKKRQEVAKLQERIGVLTARIPPRQTGPGVGVAARNKGRGDIRVAAKGKAGATAQPSGQTLGAKALQTAQNTREGLAGALAGLKRALEISQADVRKYGKAIAADRTCPECGNKVSTKHLQDKLHYAETVVKSYSSQITGLDRQYETALKVERQIEKQIEEDKEAEQEHRALQRELDELRTKRNNLKKEENPHKTADIFYRISKIRLAREKNAEEIAEAETKLGVCKYWQDAFKEIRLNLIDNVMTELEMAVTQHAESLGLQDWRVKFQTERVKTSGEVTTAFNILLYPPDQEEAIKFESYSGGESQRWQLATAFGLSEVILTRMGVDPNIEILDEPTKGLSTEGVENLLTCLRDRALEQGKAIYVTEHHSLEKGMFDGVITIQRDKKSSSIKEQS